MVAYVTGGKALQYEKKKALSSSLSASLVSVNRISRDDVDRLSRGQAAKKRGYGSRSVPHRLNEVERAELDRATRKGYLSLVGGGNRRTRKGSPLANIHRQWCDARGKPQILLFKATGGGTVDQVVVDFSPLRLNGLFDDASQVEDFMIKWKAHTTSAALECGMEIRADDENEAELNESQHEMGDDDDDDDSENSTYVITLENTNQQAWATSPIWKLPVVSFGVFEGERSSAKAMAKNLAERWEIPDPVLSFDESVNELRSKPKRNGRSKSHDRKRGGGHRQEWF